MRKFDGMLVGCVALLVFGVCAEDAPTAAARFEGHDGEPFGIEAYARFRLRDNLSLDVSAHGDDSVALDARAANTAAPLDINGSRDAASVKAVGELSLPRLLSWRGYVAWYGVFDDREAWDAGSAVHMSF